MICVVSDDFTGAAELAGVGFRYGLATEVHTDTLAASACELVVVDASSRSAAAEVAGQKMDALARQLRARKPVLLYKKVDSVLRGHVLTELQHLLAGLHKRRALLVPANPSVGRTISEDGHYFIHGQPLHETDFANDPEYPATTSQVLERLRRSGVTGPVLACSTADLPARGIAVGPAQTTAALRRWASRVDDDTIPAGAADFFQAVLETLGKQTTATEAAAACPPDWRVLFVFGSGSEQSRILLDELSGRHFPVCCLPCPIDQAIAGDSGCLDGWVEQTLSALAAHRKVGVAIRQPFAAGSGGAARLALFTARLVERIVGQTTLDELVIEGGATASAVVRQAGWQRFGLVRELAPGVVRMKTSGGGPLVTVKPGSYPWPPEVLDLLN